MTTKEELIAMKKDITTINSKIDNIDNKLDMLTARVNRNTSMRKVLVKAMWMIYAITLGALIKIFTE